MKKIYLLIAIGLISSTLTLKAQWTDESSFNQVIVGLQTFGTDVYMGGNFTKRNSVNCYWSAKFSGSTFTNHTSMIGGLGINKMEVFNGDLYATGALNIAGTSGVYKWSGTTWNSASSYTSSHTGIYADGNDLYVGSDFGTIGKKTGTGSFVAMPPMDNSNDNITAINKYNGTIIIAGKLNTFNSVNLNHIAKWDGAAWQPLGGGLSSTVKCLAVYNSELYVGGSFTTAGGQPAKYIAKWNGSSWSDVGGSMTGVGFNGIRDMVVYNNKLFVVGDFDKMGTVSTKYVAMWDGSSWTSLDLSISSSFANCVEVLNNKLYVGTFDFTDSHLYSMNLSSVGLEEEQKNSIVSIYPNPNNGKFNLVLEQNTNNALIEVFDVMGKKVSTENTFETKKTIDISEQPKGIYIIKITANNKAFTEKIIYQ